MSSRCLERYQPGIQQALPSLVFGALLWGQLAITLAPWWREGSYYDYGWLVPLLAAWCLWSRWDRLPQAQRVLTSLRPRWTHLCPTIAAILGLPFLRLVEQSDPAWRVPIWIHAFLVAGIWHTILHHVTYRSHYFLPVTLLALTAVPLPPVIEGEIIHRLTQAVLAYSVPVANLLGIPVKMAGTALTAHGQLLQIDDGCSGIRSFQSLLMISIFFGEFFTLKLPQRFLMVASGFGAAFLFNGLRTLTLTWIFFRHGETRFQEFHDVVGVTTFILSAVATYAVAWKLAEPIPPSVRATAPPD